MTVTKNILFQYVPGTTGINGLLYQPDGTTLIQNTTNCPETGTMTGWFNFPVTAAVAATLTTYKVNLAGSIVGGGYADLKELAGTYDLQDAPTALMITGAGGWATPANMTDAETAIIGAINGLGSNITVASAMSSDGTELTITQGDSYTSALGNSIAFTIANQAGLIGTVPHLRIAGVSTDLAVAPSITSGSQGVTFNDIAATATSALSVGTYRYQIRFMSGSNVVTLIQGNVIVKGGY